MGGGKSLFHRFALKQKVALIRKTKAVKTLQDELDRAATVRNQLAEMADGMSVPEGETTIRHLRSASWYGNQVHEQLSFPTGPNFSLKRWQATAAMPQRHGISIRELLNAARLMIWPDSLIAKRGLRPQYPRVAAADLCTAGDTGTIFAAFSQFFSFCAQVLTYR